jgi:serine phosphatase RsbU (regulator of sigma subunit)
MYELIEKKSMKLRILAIVLFCILTGNSVQSQTKIKTEANADIVVYTNKDGLPTTNFSNIVQTKDGYLWISGIEGTYRFDGYEFEEVGEEFGVPKMQAIYYDSLKNTLYFASPTKFVIFDGDQFKVFGKDEGYKINGSDGRTVNFVRADSKGRIWIGSSTPYIDKEFNGGLTKYENGIFTVYDSTTFPLHNASDFIETPYGDLIFSSLGRNTSTFESSYIALYKNDKFIRIDELKGVSLQNAAFINRDLNRIIDEKGNTWIALSGVINIGDEVTITNSGVLMYDGESFHEFPGLKSFLGESRGISSVHYNPSNDKIYATTYNPNSEYFNQNNKTIYEFDGDHWVNADIIKSIGSIQNLETGKTLLDVPYVLTIFIDNNRYFPEMLSLIVTDKVVGGQGTKYQNQYFTYNNDKWLKTEAIAGIPIKEVKDGLLMNTQNGFGIYYPKDYKLFTEDDGFLVPNAFIPTLYTDKNGIVWISFSLGDLPAYLGINEVGMNIWDGKTLHTITEKDGLSGNSTFSAFQDIRGRVWIPTTKGVTLCREIQNSKGEWIFKFEKIQNDKSQIYNTSKLLETSKGEIYAWQTSVGQTFGNYTSNFYLGKFDGNKFIEIPSPFDENLMNKQSQFFELRENPDGTLLLEGIFAEKLTELTTAKTHVMVYDGKSWHKAPEKWELPEEQLHYVGTLDNGMYYLTVNGFYNFNGDKFINLIDSVDANADFRLLKGASVAGTKTDNQADGKLYIRLRNRGLVIFDGINLKFYTKKDGLPSANLYNPNPDSKGNMMFSHPTGALIVKDNKFQNYYDEGSNLTGGANVTTLDVDGNLVMHYRSLGLLIKEQDDEEYPLKLSSVIIDTASYFYNFPQDLSHTENSLIFNFAALNYKDPKQTNYEYILEGYDKDWSRPGNLSFAQYQNLPHGNYTFRVKGITSNGVKTNEASYAFIIAPPFWKTWWAYTFYVLFVGFGLYSLRRFERNKMKLKEVERVRKERADARLREVELRAQISEAENKRKSKELEEARQLQLSMLPRELPNLPNIEVAVYMKTATEVGGDYYDFSFSSDGSLNVAIGDATGHGMKAGTLVSLMKALFTSDSIKLEIGEFFQSSNEALKKMRMERVMMGFAMLNIKERKVKLINAGMPPIYLYQRTNRKVEEIALHCLPLGALSIASFNLQELEITQGDTILMMSDGFPELQNEGGELFGYDRVQETFEKVANKQPEEIITFLNEIGSNWVNGNDPEDDVTFVVIKMK